MSARRVTADVEAARITAVVGNVPMHPAQCGQTVVERRWIPMLGCEAMRYGHEDGREIRDRRRHEAHPFLVAVRPRPTVGEYQNRQSAPRPSWPEDIDALVVVGPVGDVENGVATRRRPSRELERPACVDLGLMGKDR